MNGVTHYIAVLLLLQGISHGQRANTKEYSKEDQIREAVLRYQMEGWYRDGDKHEKEATSDQEKAVAKRLNFKVFFVAVNGKDPNDELIRRLQDIPRKIMKISAAKSAKQMGGLVDKETKESGIEFSVDTIRWLDEESVEVDGGYFCDSLCGAGTTYKLHHENDKWVVKSAILRWIA